MWREISLSNTVCLWTRRFLALQTNGFGVAELYNPGSRAWDENWVRANASSWTQHCPAEALITGSTGTASPSCSEPLAPCPSLAAPLLWALIPSWWAGSILSAAVPCAVPRMRCPGVTATLPACPTASAPRWGTGHFPAFCGAGFSGFNYICGLDGFAWPLKSISQRVVLKWARNICGSCGFPPGLQEE